MIILKLIKYLNIVPSQKVFKNPMRRCEVWSVCESNSIRQGVLLLLFVRYNPRLLCSAWWINGFCTKIFSSIRVPTKSRLAGIHVSSWKKSIKWHEVYKRFQNLTVDKSISYFIIDNTIILLCCQIICFIYQFD